MLDCNLRPFGYTHGITGRITEAEDMTQEEFKKVAEIVSNADGGCSVCAMSLAADLQKEFPEFDWGPEVRKGIDNYYERNHG